MAAPAWLLSVLCMLVFAPVLTLSALPRVNPNAGKSVIAATCNATSDPSLCNSMLQSDPRSRTARDTKELSIIAIGIADRDASDISSYASRLINGSTLAMCRAKYRNAGEALRSAGASLAADDKDYASVHMAAAKEYTDACRRIFNREWPGVTYPEGLVKRENHLKRLCDLIIDIISI